MRWQRREAYGQACQLGETARWFPSLVPYVLDQFRVLEKYDRRLYGAYATKDRILVVLADVLGGRSDGPSLARSCRRSCCLIIDSRTWFGLREGRGGTGRRIGWRFAMSQRRK